MPFLFGAVDSCENYRLLSPTLWNLVLLIASTVSSHTRAKIAILQDLFIYVFYFGKGGVCLDPGLGPGPGKFLL
jgi:hypothetical protein